MIKKSVRKGIIIGIIVLFLGTGISSGLNNIKHRNIEKNLLSINDENSYLDIVVTNNEANTLTVLLGKESGIFDYSGEIEVGFDAFGITTDDFDKDGFLDLAVTHSESSKISILIGDGLGGFELKGTYTVGEGPVDIVTGLFNNDEFIDIAIANAYSHDVSVLLGNGLGGFGSYKVYSVEFGPFALISEDFDDDGNLDLATANYGGSCVSVLLGYGNGNFKDYVEYDIPGSAMDLVAGDFDRDNVLDLAVVNWHIGFGGRVSVLFGYGDGGFDDSNDIPVGGNRVPRQIVTNYFNDDGNLDLAFTDQEGDAIGILLGEGTGEFGSPAFKVMNEGPTGIVSNDFNKDNNQDLAVVCQDDNTIIFYNGNGNGGFNLGPGYGFEECCAIFLVTGDFITNVPPDQPVIDGPTKGGIDQTLTYEISAIDSDGDDVYFWIEWFQGCPGVYWQGPYGSGEVVEFQNTWGTEGTYTITVKAKDTNDLESDTATLSVTIPRSKTIYDSFWFKSLDMFPILQKFFKFLLIN